jgi:hypothetical protein
MSSDLLFLRTFPDALLMEPNALRTLVPNGYKDHESSSESSGEETLVSSKVMFETNGHVESNDDSDNDNENEQKYLKRQLFSFFSTNSCIKSKLLFLGL